MKSEKVKSEKSASHILLSINWIVVSYTFSFACEIVYLNIRFAFAVNLSFAFRFASFAFRLFSQYVIDRFAMKVKSERVKSQK